MLLLTTMQEYLKALILLRITCILSSRHGTCRKTITQPPLLGYRCAFNNTSTLTNLTDTAYAQCVWRCLSTKDCVAISHNNIYNYCELNTLLCEFLEPNEEFVVNFYGVHFYGKDHRYCLQWVSLDYYDPQKAVAFPIPPDSPENIITVARLSHDAGVYPGKYRLYPKIDIRALLETDQHVVMHVGEVLQLGSGCQFAWVAYEPPNAIPLGAIIGGHIGGEILYVARTVRRGSYGIGYFRQSTQFGHFRMKTSVKTKTMELLVLL